MSDHFFVGRWRYNAKGKQEYYLQCDVTPERLERAALDAMKAGDHYAISPGILMGTQGYSEMQRTKIMLGAALATLAEEKP